MWRFGKTNDATEEVYGGKRSINVRGSNVDNIVISKLLENNSNYLIRYLEEFTRPFVLILPKVSQYFKTFKYKGGDNNNINKLMSLLVDDRSAWLYGSVFLYKQCLFATIT